MKYCKINLEKTNYCLLDSAILLNKSDMDTDRLLDIFKKYCKYKNFNSVQPMFKEEFLNESADIIGYYDKNELIAFSMINIYNSLNAENIQFAWNYENPDLRVGIRSLEHECAYYKAKGFKNLYLGTSADYKHKFDGFEILGRLE